MTQEQRLKFLTDFSMALANRKIVSRDEVEIALDNYFKKLELKLPIILSVSNPNDPPPPNWREVWLAHSPRESA